MIYTSCITFIRTLNYGNYGTSYYRQCRIYIIKSNNPVLGLKIVPRPLNVVPFLDDLIYG